MSLVKKAIKKCNAMLNNFLFCEVVKYFQLHWHDGTKKYWFSLLALINKLFINFILLLCKSSAFITKKKKVFRRYYFLIHILEYKELNAKTKNKIFLKLKLFSNVNLSLFDTFIVFLNAQHCRCSYSKKSNSISHFLIKTEDISEKAISKLAFSTDFQDAIARKKLL